VPPPPAAPSEDITRVKEVYNRKIATLKARVEDLERDKTDLTNELRKAAHTSDRVAEASRRSHDPVLTSTRRRKKDEVRLDYIYCFYILCLEDDKVRYSK
jgi:hypothetical protein